MMKKLPSKNERHKLFSSVEPGPKTKPNEKSKMADLQNTKKDFLFDLDAVGISNVKHPVVIHSKLQPTTQTSIGTFYFASSLPQHSKGTNMSRFTEQLDNYYRSGFSLELVTLKQFAKELADRLEQRDTEIKVEFPWFYERSAPLTNIKGLNHTDAWIKVNYDIDLGFEISVGMSAKITTLCPCSKEISEYSAHNQRGNVSIEVTLDADFDEGKIDWKEILLEAAESNASARIHPVLKRPDEKAVTEHAYENPRFVEDVVRLVASDLYELDFIRKFHVKCTNEESIHLHDAIASITYDKTEE